MTGTLGGPGRALAAWERGDSPDADARARFARPAARLDAGLWLSAQGASAAIDLSDGLAGDVAHLAAASGVDCVLDLDAIPCIAGASADDALRSGEEYELPIAAAAMDVARFSAEHLGLPLTAIGRVEAPRGAGEVRAERGGRPAALPSAHDHFTR